MRYAVLPLLIGCGGITPRVDAISVEPGECGTYAVTLRGGGMYGAVELLVDDHALQSWPISGRYEQTYQGTLPGDRGLGRPIVFEARAGSTFARSEVTLPDVRLEASVTLTSFEGGARLTGTLTSSCPLPGATWSAELFPGGSVGPLPLPDDGALAAGFPKLVRTDPTVTVRVHTADGRDRAVVPTVALVGDEPHLAPDAAATFEKEVADANDADHDGYDKSFDCDDHNPRVNPGAGEYTEPNGIDDDCDGKVDEGTRVYDDDGDGYSEDHGDCDDDDELRFPNARELPDCRDQDCDGEIDEGVTLPQVDDDMEPNGKMDQATDLRTGSMRSFTRTLRWVTTSRDDEEWARFHSDDGLFDDWGIDVTLYRAAPDATYQVDLFREGAPVGGQVLTAEGAKLEQRGRAMSSDSGDYWLRVRPIHVPRPYCPVEVRIWSR
ncbi:MAG TPA: putative metal-binding motif-containing protein [Myxococcota bacterium]|nr:putative metal-binding motif-containing protein [Myxococcota bacterium]